MFVWISARVHSLVCLLSLWPTFSLFTRQQHSALWNKKFHCESLLLRILQWFLTSHPVRPRVLPMTHKALIPLASSFFPFLLDNSCSGILAYFFSSKMSVITPVFIPSTWQALLPGICRLCSLIFYRSLCKGHIYRASSPDTIWKYFYLPQPLPPSLSHIIFSFNTLTI